MVAAGLKIADPVAARGGVVISETPSWMGEGSPVGKPEYAQHVNMHRTKLFQQFAEKHGMQTVHTDLCRSGHPRRKPTEFLGTPSTMQPLRCIFGTLRCNHSSHK